MLVGGGGGQIYNKTPSSFKSAGINFLASTNISSGQSLLYYISFIADIPLHFQIDLPDILHGKLTSRFALPK